MKFVLFLTIFLITKCESTNIIEPSLNTREEATGNECDAGICETKQCQKVPTKCPDNYITVVDKCGCCVECEEPPNTLAQENTTKPPSADLCLPGDCENTICQDDAKYCPNNYYMTIDRCGCCKQCVKIIHDGERCDENAQKNNKEICEEGTKCLYGWCTCEDI